MERYNLYYTLNSNIKKTKLTKKNKNELYEKLKNIQVDNLESKTFHPRSKTLFKSQAICLLILEHSIYKDGFVFPVKNGNLDVENLILPYNIEFTDKYIKFDIDNLPNELQWIIYKFVNIN